MFHTLPTPLLALLLLPTTLQAYSIGDVNPRALQGIWRLTSLDKDGLPFEKRRRLLSSSSDDPKTIWRLKGFTPMKEFTTYPKRKEEQEEEEVSPKRRQTEIFIKLKDDFTFEQCTSLYSDEEEFDTFEEQLAADIMRRDRASFAWKGTWDFVDGKLILAADRLKKKPVAYGDDGLDDGSAADTILVGKVSVNAQERLSDNPTVEKEKPRLSSDDTKGIDVHLSVPKGKIKTGKFIYPKHHPSFFEQPIFNPNILGNFELKQILGEYNTKNIEEDEQVELFRKGDLAGRRFYLSVYPLPKRTRWDEKGYEIIEEDESLPQKNIQVVALELFANNTFSTIYGLGSSEVRRGKWSIIGEKRDQIWIQVYRFGFGRSVSYGTYSEGSSLTQDDEKAYWGTITGKRVAIPKVNGTDVDSTDYIYKKIEIDGAVMVGWGLEPCSTGRFKMMEIEEEIADRDEVEDDEFDMLLEDDYDDNTNTFDLPGSFD